MKNSKKMDNKGFSLVELIIVIAIMAILVGIVGTQVIPYLNRSRVQRDVELLSAISTAAVTAYSTHADEFGDTNFETELSFPDTSDPDAAPTSTTADADKLDFYIMEFISYTSDTQIQAAMASSEGRNFSDITVYFYFEVDADDIADGHNRNTVEVIAHDADGNDILQTVVSQL